MAKFWAAQRNNEMAKHRLLKPLPAIGEIVLPRGFICLFFKSHLSDYFDRYRNLFQVISSISALIALIALGARIYLSDYFTTIILTHIL
ncbi:MAG: hypothetical protein ACRCZN_13415 [Lactococcus lactis]